MSDKVSKTQYADDKFVHLESDIEKIRKRFRQYISYGGAMGALEVSKEILFNAIDEIKNPRSPGDSIVVEFDERTGFIRITDNGRGIPLDILEDVYVSLNYGSNIDTSDKASLGMDNLGLNGVGSLATCGLAEHVEITSYRGLHEGKWKQLIFEEGVKKSESSGKCDKSKHGMDILFKPSKIMGKDTKIIWADVQKELDNLQFLNKKLAKLSSIYINAKGVETKEKYKIKSFENILDRNDKESIISQKYMVTVGDNNVIEELAGDKVKRFVSMDMAFVYTSSLTPYIDSFSNSNNTVDNGDHLDAAIESVCRVLQTMTKNSMSEKEREKLDIKWDDVKTGLSIVVALRTNYENLYTGQTKHKVVSPELKRTLITLLMDQLTMWLNKNTNAQRELIQIVKMNAKARREGEKIRTAVVKTTLTNWSQFTMKHFDPCSAKGKEYKELFIIEGDSARGSLKNSRDPKFQSLYSIKGVSMNAYRVTLDQIVGPKGNKEFNDLITIMGCNVGSKFDISKLNYDKIIIASDADKPKVDVRVKLL